MERMLSATSSRIYAQHIGLGILLKMELAALPGHGGKNGLACGGHAWMSIADDERGATQAACDQQGKEGAPMDLSLTQRYADAKDSALAIHAVGDEHCAVHEQAAMAHLLVTSFEDKIRARFQLAVAPELEFHIELGRAGAHLRGADLMATKLLNDLGDFARRDALHIHLRHRESARLLAAHAAQFYLAWLSALIPLSFGC